MKHTKKIIVGILVMLMSLTTILTLVACGSAPSYVSNPPENSEELVEKLEGNGWKIVSNTSLGGMTTIIATKFSKDLDDVKPEDKITMEMASVFYFDNEELAKAYKETAEAAAKVAKDSAPSGVSFSYSVTQKGKVVSSYYKASGKFSNMEL